MTDSSSLSISLDGVEPVPDAAETTGGDLVGNDPPAVGREPAPEIQEILHIDEESNLLEENTLDFRFLSSAEGSLQEPVSFMDSPKVRLPVIGFCPSNRSSIAPLLRQLKYLGTRSELCLQGRSTEEQVDLLRQETFEKFRAEVLTGERHAVVCEFPSASFDLSF